MTRRILTFDCLEDELFGTLDSAEGESGLLIVSGGNEIRSGAWAGQAELAARVAARGYPVFRFDRRGVGDSEGANRGFRESRDDIAAAIVAFSKAAPHLRRVVAFGNCDAASALMLFAAELDLHGLLLANPWVIENDEDAPQARSALRRRYAAKLRDPAEWKRLASGGVDFRKLAGGLRQAAAPVKPSALAAQMRESLARFDRPARILLAEGDRTAQLFLEAWERADPRIERIASASHSFADEAARKWLFAQALEALQGPEP